MIVKTWRCMVCNKRTWGDKAWASKEYKPGTNIVLRAVCNCKELKRR